MEVTFALARHMLELAGIEADPEQAITSGRALDTFKEMVKVQGGDPEAPLPRAAHRQGALHAETSGWVTRLDARAVGVAAWRLGAGRARKEDDVSLSAGIRCLAKPGDYVQRGEPVLELHTDDPGRFAPALEALDGALRIAGEPLAAPPLILDQVGA
jgi:thymidine phosphorylase